MSIESAMKISSSRISASVRSTGRVSASRRSTGRVSASRKAAIGISASSLVRGLSGLQLHPRQQCQHLVEALLDFDVVLFQLGVGSFQLMKPLIDHSTPITSCCCYEWVRPCVPISLQWVLALVAIKVRHGAPSGLG